MKSWFKEKFLPWAKAAGIRAIKTMAQTASGFIVVGAAINEIDWAKMASVSLVAGVASILTSIPGLPELKLREREGNA